MDDLRTRTVVCCYRGRVGIDLIKKTLFICCIETIGAVVMAV
jgi:hypothetical protein